MRNREEHSVSCAFFFLKGIHSLSNINDVFSYSKTLFSKAEKRENGVELLTHKTKWPRDRLVMTFFSKVWFIFFVASLREKNKV